MKSNIKELTEIIKKSKSMSSYVRLIKKDNQLLTELINRTFYLNDDCSIIERLYHIKHDLYKIPICSVCNKNLKWNIKFSKYYTCGNVKCFYKLNPEKDDNRRKKISEAQKNFSDDKKKDIRKKIEKTNMDKYGVDSYAKTIEFKDFMIEKIGYVSPFSLKETHEKSKKTLIEKTGYDHNFKIPEVKEKRKQTFLNNYGFNTPTKNQNIIDKSKITNLNKYSAITYTQTEECKEKIKKTNLLKYGKESYSQTEEYKERYKNTCLEKYDSEHWMQNDDNFKKYEDKLKKSKKSSYKEYILENNKKVYLQGYEDYALFNMLLKIYELDDIIIDKKEMTKYIGKIFYEHNNKIHKYYPDFYIKSKNLIIEIKSIYTYESNIEINNLKKQAIENNNINFEYIIINPKEYKNWKNKK